MACMSVFTLPLWRYSILVTTGWLTARVCCFIATPIPSGI
ncbi:hypothetical protein YPPY07_0190 [Yersinia pestis PY-07]|nr:hypothetical protein YPPY07_0190 [Yersinia pestis PY-07]EIT03444.1 hypothetical protein YPPY89_0318 [Yersinia pestis PY-89]